MLEAVVTQPQPRPALRQPASSGAIWLDDLALPQAQDSAAHAADTVPGTLPELAITLLEVEAGAPVSAQWSLASPPPHAAALMWPDHEPPRVPAPAPAIARVASLSAQPHTVQARRKAERRAAVRKSRLRSKTTADAASTASEVLVFDTHTVERERLRKLLRDFGFRVYAVGSADEAAALAASHSFVAAFVDIALELNDGRDGLDLCQRVRTAGASRGGVEALLIVTATRLKPTDRVRAELAGCDELILKPVTRGSVAGVLDSRGVVLPTDQRQG